MRKFLADGPRRMPRLALMFINEPRQIAEFANRMQQFVRRQTRQGIPLLVQKEASNGFAVVGAPASPPPRPSLDLRAGAGGSGGPIHPHPLHLECPVRQLRNHSMAPAPVGVIHDQPGLRRHFHPSCFKENSSPGYSRPFCRTPVLDTDSRFEAYSWKSIRSAG